MDRKFLNWLVVVLILAVGIQGYFLYRLSERLDASTSPETVQTDPFGNDWFDPDPDFPMGPWEEIQRMQERMNRLFNDTFAQRNSKQPFDELFRDRTISPSLDLRDTGDRYILKLDLPGAEESQIDVTIENERTLIVEAETRDSRESAGRLLHRERYMGRFRRRLTLPEAVDPAGMESDYKDGVLTLNIKKKSAIS